MYSVSALHTMAPVKPFRQPAAAQMSGLLLLLGNRLDPLFFPPANLNYWSQAEVGTDDRLRGAAALVC